MRYKNIQLPDMLKEVEMTDFHFNVHMDGKITFEIHYEQGVLPEVFPEARTRVSRAAQRAAKATGEAALAEEATLPAQEKTALAIIPEAPVKAAEGEASSEASEETMEEVSENSTMEIHYNATGPRRKELATAVGAFLEATPVYQSPDLRLCHRRVHHRPGRHPHRNREPRIDRGSCGTGFHRSINQQTEKAPAARKTAGAKMFRQIGWLGSARHFLALPCLPHGRRTEGVHLPLKFSATMERSNKQGLFAAGWRCWKVRHRLKSP